MDEDAPNHYAKMKFKPSSAVTGAFVSSAEYGTVEFYEHILVRFIEVELKQVLYSEWSDLLNRKN